MRSGNIAVFGIYASNIETAEAVDALKSAGFRSTDISILFPENPGSKDFGHEKHTKAPEGAVAAGGSGAILGAAAGWFLGMGALMIPGLESLTAGGPVVASLAGMGAGLTAGGITGAIVGLAVPEYEAKRFAGRMRNGGILLSVHCDDQEWARSATKVLKETGAFDIGQQLEAKADFAAAKKPMPRRLSRSM